MMKTTYINNAQDVAALLTDARTGKRRSIRNIEVRLEGMEKSEAENLSKEINKHYFACGCSEGTVFVLLALAGLAGWVLSNTESLNQLGWKQGLSGLGIVLIAAGIGKGIGKWRASFALKKTVNKLIKYAPEATEIGKGDGSARCAVNRG